MQVRSILKLLRIVLVLVPTLVCWGQTAQVTGRIADPGGAIVPGAALTLTNVGTGIERNTVSNDQGYYSLPLLSPGVYTLTVRKDGFQTLKHAAFELQVGQTARMDVTLQLGAVSESVTVAATAPLLVSENAAVGQVIGNRKILDLPLNGRDFTQLATLVPGAISRGTNSAIDAPMLSINGGRTSKTVFMMDGANITNQYYDGASLTPSVDAIQEFRVQTSSFSAEHGQGSGIIFIALKSGTNELHGGVFEFLRNEAFDARNFFNNSNKRPPLKQNQFGFSLGGPVTIPRVYTGKDKTFFFTDYEGTRLRRPATSNNPVPSASMREGDFSAHSATIFDPLTTPRQPFPGNRIPANRVAPQADYFLDFYPQANTGSGTYSYSPTRTNGVDRFDIRIDHRFSEADTVSGSYSFHATEGFSPGQFEANGAEELRVRKQVANIGHVHSFTPTMLNELRAVYTRLSRLQSQPALGVDHTALSGIGGFEDHSRAFPGFPALTISGFLSFTDNGFRPLSFRENNYQFSDNLTLIRGGHSLKFGFLYRAFSSLNFNAGRSRGFFSFTGTYTGNSFADFLLGLPASGGRTFARDAYGISRIANQNFFVQDDWKVTSRLTLSLGLRYEVNHQPVELHNQASSVDPVKQQIVVLSDSQGELTLDGQQITKFVYPMFADIIVPSSDVGLANGLRRLDKNNFAPRLGVAWRPMGRDFVIRTGYGVFYGLVQGNRTSSTAFVNPPFLADESSVNNTTPVPTKTLADLFASPSQGQFNLAPLTFFQINPDVRDPYIQEWNFAVQKVVKQVLSFEGAYVGSKGTKLEHSRGLNVPRPGPGTIQGRRPWTRFSAGSYVDNDAYSNYNAFQGRIEVRGWRGLSLLASYAFAKSIDNISIDAQGYSAQDPDNDRAEKGVSDFDVKHRFVTSANYALPFGRNARGVGGYLARGWELGGILTLQSGLPFTPGIGTDVANTGTPLRRPDRIGNGAVANRTLLRDFDPSAFVTPAPFTYGNSGRNILYRRGFRNLDLTVLRNFKLGERANMQFRAEFFNFTNTPAFAAPSSNIQAGSVGQVLNTAADPRDIQFALRLSF
ncbi:MAG: TonB-dependent receptor [Bryobacteraceae bacterium]|nr:TonB-dependent receptor [Bryobacteraceae bacterium]